MIGEASYLKEQGKTAPKVKRVSDRMSVADDGRNHDDTNDGERSG